MKKFNVEEWLNNDSTDYEFMWYKFLSYIKFLQDDVNNGFINVVRLRIENILVDFNYEQTRYYESKLRNDLIKNATNTLVKLLDALNHDRNIIDKNFKQIYESNFCSIL